MKKIYWLVPLAIFGVQMVFTLSSNHQIRNEEAVSSIREVWWFANHSLYQPNNANIGWYGALSLIYSLFGFDLFSAKVYRLALSLISLYCTAALLKKYLGEKLALIPLLTIGFSPEVLFFNTIANNYGIDLQFFPIIAWLMLGGSGKLGELGRLGGASLSMVAWLTYPTFVFYLPVLVLATVHLGGVKAHPRGVYLGGVLIWLAVFLAPLVAFIVYFKGWPGNIFFAGGSFKLSEELLFGSIGGVFSNLFDRASAYYLEIPQVEFSLIFPIFSVLFMFYLCFRQFKESKSARPFISLILFTALFNLVIIGFTIDGGMPGGRRNTPILAGIYALFVLAWHYITKFQVPSSKFQVTGMVILSLILVHHLIALPLNLESIKNPSFFKLNIWFGEGNPNDGFQQIISQVQERDIYLNCDETYKGNYQCQYGIIYAAVAQACLLNHLSCNKIYGYFPTAGYQELSIDTINYWQENGFEH